MEFFALPVYMGDSFLLKDKNFNLLVDGGDGKVDILYHLKNQLGQKPSLNVVICSHYDRDHIDGLLNFFQHLIDEHEHGVFPSVKIGEVWLPDIFARINATLRRIYIPKYKRKRETLINVERTDGALVEVEKTKGEFDVAIYRICRIVRICFALRYLGIVGKIRWFELTDSYVNQIVSGTNVYGINCSEVERTISPCLNDASLKLEYTKINQDSLVFRYNPVDQISPNVLFTADSNFYFCERNAPVIVEFNSGRTIVTTPHHGSNDDQHIKVYTNLGRIPREFIFVRSSEIHKSRPCSEFALNNSDNYCVRCKDDDEQTIHLIYNSGGGWKAASGIKKCYCTPVPRKK